MTKLSFNNAINNRNTLKVGITGGIGSGKSTVSRLFEIMNYPVYYTDQRAKWLMDNDLNIKKQLINTFGKHVYPNHLDRQALAKIVFSDKTALKKLNNITHPAVEDDFADWVKTQNSRLVFKEAAILFESDTQKSVDKVICVTAPEKSRIKRVMKRDNCTAEQVLERINNQWPENKKIELSDYIITSDDKNLVITQALKVLDKINFLLQ